FVAFVTDRLNPPNSPNVLVESLVHCASGSAMLLELSRTNVPFGIPLAPDIDSVVPLNMALLIVGGVSVPTTVMVPLVARALDHDKPGASVGNVVLENDPV